MPSIKKTVICGLFFVCALFLENAIAIPLDGDPLAEYSGMEPFLYTQSGRTQSGHVEYAVYQAANYFGTTPSAGDYVYAYQIYNATGSNTSISFFSTAILENANVYEIYSDINSGPDIEPYLEYFLPDDINPESAEYAFAPIPGFGQAIGPGQNSSILVFTSDNTWYSSGFGTVAGGGISTMLTLPAPVPEPAMFALLTLGVLPLIRRKHKTIKKRS